VELEIFSSFLNHREVLCKSGTAQYIRHINTSWMNPGFSHKLAFSTEYRFILIPLSIKDLVFSRGRGGGEQNQQTHKTKSFTLTLVLQLQPAIFCPKLLSRCPMGVVGQVFQTTFPHFCPGCCSSYTLQHPALPLPRDIPLLSTFHNPFF